MTCLSPVFFAKSKSKNAGSQPPTRASHNPALLISFSNSISDPSSTVPLPPETYPGSAAAASLW